MNTTKKCTWVGRSKNLGPNQSKDESGRDDSGREDSGRLAIERLERIVYLADMISEMQDLAAREGCATLSGLLSLSHAEARRQVAGPKGRE
jgi:hypothetical protein